MAEKDICADIEIAKILCEEIRSDGLETSQTFIHLYRSFYSKFLNFTRRRLFIPDHAEDVLQNFWLEILNGNAICEYKGKNGASLYTYLLKILNWRIIDENRRQRIEERERPVMVNSFLSTCTIVEQKRTDDGETIVNYGYLPEEKNEEILRELINESLSLLSEFRPLDATYIKLHFLEDLPYEEIAVRLIGRQANSTEIKKKTDAIKKQVPRKKTGSMSRFKVILKRLMEQKRVTFNDLIP